MKKTVREVMTKHPVTIAADETCVSAARKMAKSDIGDVLVEEADGRICGIVTDRDIVIRAVAQGRDPATTRVGDVCTHKLVSLSPDDDTEDAMRVMREKAVRRIPVMEHGRPVGIVSLGDLAMDRAPDSVLGQVCAAAPNN